jgi:hypothetical protein
LCCRPYSAGILHSVSDQIQNLQNCFTTPNKMTSEDDIKGLVSLKFLCPRLGPRSNVLVTLTYSSLGNMTRKSSWLISVSAYRALKRSACFREQKQKNKLIKKMLTPWEDTEKKAFFVFKLLFSQEASINCPDVCLCGKVKTTEIIPLRILLYGGEGR